MKGNELSPPVFIGEGLTAADSTAVGITFPASGFGSLVILIINKEINDTFRKKTHDDT